MSSTPEQQRRAYLPTPPEELLARVKRRSAVSRRRRLVGASGSLSVVVVLVLIGALLFGGGVKPRQQSHRPGATAVSARIDGAYEITANEPARRAAPAQVAKAVEQAEIGFSLALLNNLAASSDTTGSTNVLVSPSSLSTALAMLELGARGATQQGIATTLHTAGLSPVQQAAGWHTLAVLLAAETSTTSADLKNLPELTIANALFLQQHFAVLPAFVAELSSEFQTGLWQVDFQKNLSAATAAINDWTSENTKGLIKKLFSPGALNPLTRLVLADAVYFHADWASPFKTATTDRLFYPGTGPAEDVPFMSSPALHSSKELYAPLSVTEKYVAVELPYAGNKLSALVLMPIGTTLSQFVSSLTPSALAEVTNGLSPSGLQLVMPTFTERSDYQLNQTLSSMGMSQAFGPSSDLSGIALQPPLYVQAVEQRAYLQVTPKGTTAAAVTGVAVGMSATVGDLHPIVIDHPFLFLVRDNSSGAILFESMVENPAS